jgi:hypothetical protein
MQKANWGINQSNITKYAVLEKNKNLAASKMGKLETAAHSSPFSFDSPLDRPPSARFMQVQDISTSLQVM